MATKLQNLDRFQKLINADGTPTEYFIRLLQTANLVADETASEVEGAAPASRLINTNAPLIGGGDLSADRALGLDVSGVTPGSYTNTDLTVDEFGRITSAADGTGGGGAFSGARVRRSSDFAVAASDTEFLLSWQVEMFDTAGFFDASAPTRFTVPAGVSYVSLVGTLVRNANGSNYAVARIHHYNSANTLQGSYVSGINAGGQLAWVNCSTGPVAVVAGDYFTITWQAGTSASPLASGVGGSFFSIQALG